MRDFGFPFRKSGADRRGGGGVLAMDGDHSVALAWENLGTIAGKNDELHQARKDFRMTPLWQCRPLVATHDPEPFVAGVAGDEFLHGQVGKRRSICFQLGEIGFRPRDSGERCAQPLGTGGAGGRRAACFVRGNMTGKEPHLIELRGILSEGGEMDVTIVDGIEGAAENPDPFHARSLERGLRDRH